jgi:hypothetical protein
MKPLHFILILVVALGLLCEPAVADIIHRQDFRHADHETGLPPGWWTGPPAHTPYVTTSRDIDSFGESAPSLRVEIPTRTLNFYVSSPRIRLPELDADYTLEVALRVDQPNSPFSVEVIIYSESGEWLEQIQLFDFPGEQMDSLRVFRSSFHASDATGEGSCRFNFGMPYRKTLQEGSFWIDDFILETGRGAETLEIYCRPTTVSPGEDVEICVSCGAGEATLEVYLEMDAPLLVTSAWRLTGLSEQPVPSEAWRTGCSWPSALRLRTNGWPPGLFRVTVDDGDNRASTFFVVRRQSGEAPILIILPTHTEQAYSDWGGQSFYSTPPSVDVSFDRPLSTTVIGPYSGYIQLIRWLTREVIPYAVANDDDLHERPDLLYSYPGIIIPGHSEYWTGGMRDNVEDYIDAGGSVICLSGNTCWWQTRMEERDGDRKLVCYKYSAGMDPYRSIDPSLVTTRWDEPPLNDPATRFLALSWREGGHVNAGTSYNCPCQYDWLDGHGGYEVFGANHWVFEGTGLLEGDQFGQPLAIVGYEVDGALIEWVDDRPFVLPDAGTPSHFQILGYAPCWNYLRGEDAVGNALMGIMEQGDSYVFNGGTTGWCFGLAGDPQVQQVTRNLIERLDKLPVRREFQPRLWAYPNPTSRLVTLELLGDPGPLQVYAVDGRCVARLETRWLSPKRSEVTWDFRGDDGRRLVPGAYWVRWDEGKSRRIIYLR